MAVSDNIQSFRRARASELNQFARVIGRLNICDPFPIFEAAKQLEDFTYIPKISPADDVNYDYWGYNIKNLNLYFETLPRHTHPENVTNLSLNLEMKVILDANDYKLLTDPFKSLEFNIILQGSCFDNNGNAKEVLTSLHLDRHLSLPDDGEPEDIHPIYHFQFGGRKLNKKYRDFGNALILDSPRIVHYPMDIVLGFDFILSNFFYSRWKDARRDGEYSNLLKYYQEVFWKPYAHSKASHWQPFELQNISWAPMIIWPSLLKSN